jgi:hypothetical protein
MEFAVVPGDENRRTLVTDYTEEEMRAQISVGLTQDRNPDQLASVLRKSEELGIDPGAVEQLDNTMLTPRFEAKGHRAETLRFLGRDPYVAGLLRNDADKMDEVGADPASSFAPGASSVVPFGDYGGQAAVTSSSDIREAVGSYLAQRYGGAIHAIRKRGYTAKQLSDLALRGYERQKDGTFLYDGKSVKEPVLQEWITGETEAVVRERAEQWYADRWKKAVAAAKEVSRDEGFGAGSDLSWLGDTRLTPSQRHRRADAAIAYLERRIALLNTLHAIQPGWNSKGTKEIEEYVKLAGERLGADFSDFRAEELLKGGIESVDYWQCLNLFGVLDIARAFSKKTPEELRVIGKDASLEDKVEKITALAALADEARGRTVGAKIVQGVASSLPFILEIMGTGGLATVASAAGRIGLRPALTGLLRNAGIDGFRSGLAALGKRQTYTELIPQAVRMIGEAEARRLPAYLPKGAALAHDEGSGEPFYYYGNDGMKIEIPAADFDSYAEAFSRAMVNQYIENVTEQAGFFFPEAVLTKLLPKRVKASIFRHVLRDLEKDPVRYSAFWKGLHGVNPIDGVLGEYMEEKLGDWIRYGATRLAEFTELNALNFRQDSLIGSAEDEAVTAGVVALQSSLMGTARAAAMPLHYRRVARWIDTHRGLVEKLSAIRATATNPGIVEEFVSQTAGASAVFVSAEDAQEFRQSSPEFADAIGLTDDAIASYGKDGRLVPVSGVKLAVAEAGNPKFREAGESFLQKAVLPGISGRKMEDILGREITDEALEEYQERIRKRRTDLRAKAASVFEPAKAAGIPGAEEAEKLFYRMIQYINLNSEADIDAVLEGLSLRTLRRPEGGFGGQVTVTRPAQTDQTDRAPEVEKEEVPAEEEERDFGGELEEAVSTLQEEVENKDMLNVEKEAMRDLFRVSLAADQAIRNLGYASIDDYANAVFSGEATDLNGRQQTATDPASSFAPGATEDKSPDDSLRRPEGGFGGQAAVTSVSGVRSTPEEGLDVIFALAKTIRDNPGEPARFGAFAGVLTETGYHIGADPELLEHEAQEEAQALVKAKIKEGMPADQLKAFAKQALEEALKRAEERGGKPESVTLPEGEREIVTASRRLAAALYNRVNGSSFAQGDVSDPPTPDGYGGQAAEASMVDVPALGVDIRDAGALRKMILERYLGKEVEIKSDGQLVLFTGKGLRDSLKVRGVHRKAFAALDRAIESAYPVGTERNDGLPKHAGLKGQRIYAALLNLVDGETRQPYIATIKLDEPLSETETRVYFKNITIEKADALFSDARQTERPVRKTVRHSTLPGSVRIAESRQRIPDAWAQAADSDRVLTIQEVVEFVKRKFADNPLFEEIYFQKRPDPASSEDSAGTSRGAITFAKDFDRSYQAVVTLLKSAADGSTLPHECAHWLYKMMESLVKNGMANETMAEDFRKLNAWLDSGSKGDYRERMEYFARGFEAYLREGHAPDLELTGVFRTLKRLLMNIYRSVKALNVQLNDDVRRVFDSILSVENIVENEAGVLKAIQEAGEILTGLSAEDRSSIGALALEARERAKERILAEREKRMRELRKLWTADANAELLAIPVYRAWTAIRQAGGLDGAEVQSLAGEGVAAELRKRGLLARKGRQASAADYVVPGFASAEEMLRSLAESPNPREYVEKYLREREKDFDDAEQMEMIGVTTEADIALIDRIVEELSVRLNREGSRLSRAKLKASANAELEEWKLKELLNESLPATIAKQARDLLHSLSGKTQDYEEAFRIALNLRKNIELAKGAARMRTGVRRAVGAMKRMSHAKKEKVEERYRGALLDLFHRIGISEREAGQHNGEAAALIAEQNAREDGSVEWEEFLGTVVEEYPEMTLERFQRVAEFAQWLYGSGRDLVAQEKAAFRKGVADHVAECIGTMESGTKRYTDLQNKSWKEKAGSILRSGRFWTEKLWTIARRADGYRNTGTAGKPGPVERIVRGMSNAVSRYMELRQSADGKINAALKALAETQRDLDGLPAFTGSAAEFGYTTWTQEMLLAAALNLGTETNRQRLRDGYGWTEEELNTIAERFSPEDWEQIQSIWDALGKSELTRKTQETFREENHFSLKLVEASPFTVDGREIAGGYYPLSYLYRTGRLAEEYLPKSTPEILHGKVSSVQARSDHEITVGPVRLSLGVLTEHIDNTAYYAACRMAMRHALGVILDPAFAESFRRTQSTEAYRAFSDLAKYAARPHEETLGFLKKLEAWGRGVMTSTALMGSVSTMAMQMGSATVGVEELGGFYPKSLARYLSNPPAASKFVQSKSAFLRDRANFMDIDLREGVRAFRPGKASEAARTLRKWGYAGMRMLDVQLASVLWNGAYEKGLTADGMSDAEAVAYADDFVARTQGGARTVDLSPFQLTEFGRFLAPFISATNAAYNVLLHNAGAMRHGVHSSVGAAILANALIPWIIPILVRGLLAGGNGDDGHMMDRRMRAMIREALSSPFGGIPVLRDAADILAGAVSAKITGQPASAGGSVGDGSFGGLTDAVKDSASSVSAAWDGDYRKALYKASRAAGAMFRLPVIQIYDRARRIADGWNMDLLPELSGEDGKKRRQK